MFFAGELGVYWASEHNVLLSYRNSDAFRFGYVLFGVGYMHHRIGIIIVNESLATDHVPSKHEILNQCWFKVGPPSTTLAQS